MMAKKLKPGSLLRRLQKRARQLVLQRDHGACIICGSTERAEAAHIVPPPRTYFLKQAYESNEQLEKAASPFYRPENMVLLCHKCHMLLDYPYLLQEFIADVGPKKAAELVSKALIDAGVPLEDVKSGENERVLRRVIEHMFDLYGPDFMLRHMELESMRKALKDKEEDKGGKTPRVEETSLQGGC